MSTKFQAKLRLLRWVHLGVLGTYFAWLGAASVLGMLSVPVLLGSCGAYILAAMGVMGVGLYMANEDD